MTRARPDMTEPTWRAKVTRTVGPESLAAILSVAVLATFLVVIGPLPGVPSNPTPSQPASVGLATDSGRPTGSQRTPTTSTAPTPAAWAAEAMTLLGAEERLITIRERLADAVDDDPPSTNEIARELRTMNTTLTAALAATKMIEASGGPVQLVNDLNVMHEGALRVSLETLGASVQNAPAYEAGATDIIAILKSVESMTERVRTEAGLPPVSAP